MPQPIALSPEACRQRQARLREKLADDDIDAALITHPRHVHYFTGHWGRSVFASAVLIERAGSTVLATAYEADAAADERVVFPATRQGTLIDDQPTSALASLDPWLIGARSIGCDEARRLPGRGQADVIDLMPALLGLRRAKDADEVAMLRCGIAGCDAAYAYARRHLEPGVSEMELYASLLAEAVRGVGEPIGEMGNDFQSGAGGGPPRHRAVEVGELMPLDIAVVVRGYSADLCRTFAVGRNPSKPQREAHALVMQALTYVEATARPGVSCRKLHNDVVAMIDGRNGWSFPHHLGHGIGLSCHEAPRLNPHWDDVLYVGDVFTAEPGLYHPDLRAGVRVEQDYLVTESGVERLSHFPTDL